MKPLLYLLPFLGFCAVTPAKANLVQNPGFETGNFSNWTTNTCNGCQTWGVGNALPHSGNNMAAARCVGVACLDPVTGSYIKQTLTTDVSEIYTLSFWYDPHSVAGSTELDIYWDGSLIGSLPNKPLGYVQYTFSGLTATSTATVLQFNGRQDPTFSGLDDIDVEATAAGAPEPASLIFTATGLAAAGMLRRKNRR